MLITNSDLAGCRRRSTVARRSVGDMWNDPMSLHDRPDLIEGYHCGNPHDEAPPGVSTSYGHIGRCALKKLVLYVLPIIGPRTSPSRNYLAGSWLL